MHAKLRQAGLQQDMEGCLDRLQKQRRRSHAQEDVGGHQPVQEQIVVQTAAGLSTARRASQ